MPDDILDDLAETRAELEAARRLLEAQDTDLDQLRAAASRLERMAEAVARIERLVAEQAVAEV